MRWSLLILTKFAHFVEKMGKIHPWQHKTVRLACGRRVAGIYEAHLPYNISLAKVANIRTSSLHACPHSHQNTKLRRATANAVNCSKSWYELSVSYWSSCRICDGNISARLNPATGADSAQFPHLASSSLIAAARYRPRNPVLRLSLVWLPRLRHATFVLACKRPCLRSQHGCSSFSASGSKMRRSGEEVWVERRVQIKGRRKLCRDTPGTNCYCHLVELDVTCRKQTKLSD